MKSIATVLFLAILTLNIPLALAHESTLAKPVSGKSAAMGMIDEKQIAQMQENLKSMQSNMQMMHGMRGPMMGGQGGMGMGSGGAGPSKISGMDLKQRQDVMERRMDMTQMMMEQMMQHDQINQKMPMQ